MLIWVKENDNSYFIVNKGILAKIAKSQFDIKGIWYAKVRILYSTIIPLTNRGSSYVCKEFPHSHLDRAKSWVEKTIKESVEDLFVASKQLAEDVGVDTGIEEIL